KPSSSSSSASSSSDTSPDELAEELAGEGNMPIFDNDALFGKKKHKSDKSSFLSSKDSVESDRIDEYIASIGKFETKDKPESSFMSDANDESQQATAGSNKDDADTFL